MRSPASAVPLLALLLLTGCAATPPATVGTGAPVIDSYAAAVPVLDMGPINANGNWTFQDFAAKTEVTGSDIVFHFRAIGDWRCRYADTPQPQVRKRPLASPPTSFDIRCDHGYLSIWGDAARNATRVAAWQFMAGAGGESAPEREAFIAVRDEYRAGRLGPDLPESVRMSKVQAELAVREHRYWEAAQAFEQGLRAAPWWPQGNYNVALIYGDLRVYPLAVRYMQRYLELVPDAANARQAQDKVYEWMAQEQKR